VRTGRDTDTRQDLHGGARRGASAIWNNSDDTVLLFGVVGNPVARYEY